METVSRRIPSAYVRLVLLLALCASLVAGCTTPPGGTPGGTATPPGLPTFPTAPTTTTPALPKGVLTAYRSSTELGLVDGTKIVATAPGTFTPSNEPFVTEDGRFLFARSNDGKLVTLDARTGKSQVIPLPKASRVGTAGASMIVWWEQPNRLMQLDLSAEAVAPTLRQTVNLPPVAGASDPALLTARGGTVVLSRVESAPSPTGGPDTLYAVRGDVPASLGTADSNTPVAVAELSPDGASLAYALYRRSSNSCGTAAVVVSNADGTQQTYDVAAPGPATASEVLHMWWQEGHAMELSLATWQCDPTSAYSPRVWELGSDRLVQTTPPTVALQAIDVIPGQRALIIPQGGPAPEQSGTMVVEDSGRRFPVKPGVDALDVIPAQAPE